jgi:anti-sigma B factor antagonist
MMSAAGDPNRGREVAEDQLQTSVVSGDGSATVIVGGEIDLAGVHDLARVLRDALDRGLPSLVVDLSAVTFCDSSGLGQFLHAAQDCATRGVGFQIVGAMPNVRKLFEISGTAELLRD